MIDEWKPDQPHPAWNMAMGEVRLDGNKIGIIRCAMCRLYCRQSAERHSDGDPALREVKCEESLDNADDTLNHAASDSAYWAVGDALIEECGVDPVWDLDDEYWPYDFKGGSALHAASDWLADHGMLEAPCELLQYRMISESVRDTANERHLLLSYRMRRPGGGCPYGGKVGAGAGARDLA
jgi:hypothetical protein